MARPRKYIAGSTPLDLLCAVAAIAAGSYLMLAGKPMHPGFLRSMRLETLQRLCAQRRVYAADINPDWMTAPLPPPRGANAIPESPIL